MAASTPEGRTEEVPANMRASTSRRPRPSGGHRLLRTSAGLSAIACIAFVGTTASHAAVETALKSPAEISALQLHGAHAAATTASPTAHATAPAASSASSSAVDVGAPSSGLVGSVHVKPGNGLRGPLQAAGVYAYRLADLSLRKVVTDQAGRFSFASLPAGLYKIIAHKPGFVPAVVMLTRATASAYQQLELELTAEDPGELGEADFWQIRERIPRDVLREITLAHGDALADLSPDSALHEPALRAEMRALTGVGDYFGAQQAAVHGGIVDLEGRFGGIGLGVEGQFRQLESQGSPDQPTIGRTVGHASALQVSVEAPHESLVLVSGHQGMLRRENEPIELERYHVSWAADVGPGRSEVSAQYTAESNFYRDPRFSSLALPPSSQTLEVAGTYQTEAGPVGSLRTGISYRERRSDEVFGPMLGALPYAQERVDLFGLGDLRVHPDVALQYGLFTTVQGEGVAAAPHVGVVLDLGELWQADVVGRQRFTEMPEVPFVDFLPVYYRLLDDCSVVESGCYRVRLTRNFSENGKASLAGLHREYSDAVRVYFSEDFFDQLESLFFVEGDELPEVQLVVEHRLSPNVMARFQSNVARGGGGLFESGSQRYSNRLGYVVTSVETRFENTETDVELAYRAVDQRMSPVGDASPAADRDLMTVEMDRLRLLLTQNLRTLLGLSTDWAVLLDLQLSRGGESLASLPEDDEIRRRVVGGIAVRF